MTKPARPPHVLRLAFATGALSLPVLTAGTAAATASTVHRVTAARSVKVNGKTFAARQWGTVTVSVTLQTGGRGTAAARKFTDLGGGYTYHTSRSQFIMSQALPILRQEFLAAQSARIQMASGATSPPEAFVQSLQSALLKANA